MKFHLFMTITADKGINEFSKQDARKIPSTLKILQNFRLPSLIRALMSLYVNKQAKKRDQKNIISL